MVIPFLLLLLLLLGPASAAAQAGPCEGAIPAPASLTGIRAEYLRAAEVTGVVEPVVRGLLRASALQPASRCAAAGAGPWAAPIDAAPAPWLSPAPTRLHYVYNAAYPRDRANGALWAGRGGSVGAEAGVVVRYGPVTAALAPVVTYSQNRDFTRVAASRDGYHPLASPWHTEIIDWPQRPGYEARTTTHPGQSYIRFDRGAFTAGASTENLWIGPARRNPVLMSNTAPGFPHLFAGTRTPLDTRIGGFDVQLLAGALEESEYWDDDADNDHRLLTAFTLVYLPRWAPGLQVGTGRVYEEVVEPGRLPLDRVLLNLVDVPGVETASGRRGNEISSVFARWVFPGAGFEAYGEWAREEDPSSLLDLLMEPDYTQGYMLGVQKVIPGRALWWRLWGELTHLAPSTPVVRGRDDAPFYTSAVVGQGHTHRGQLLGAWIGPGSETQALGLDLFHPFGLVGIYGERVRFDDAAYYEVWARYYGEARHDVEVTAGARASAVVGAFEASLHMAWSTRYDRSWVTLDAINRDPFEEDNLMVEAVLSWSP